MKYPVFIQMLIFNDTKSEFSGFGEVSDGDYTCKLYISKNVEVSDTSDVSDVSDVDVRSMISMESLDSSLVDDAIDNLDQSDYS